MAIEFIEKEPYYDASLFTGQCLMYPTFVVKNGKEYFMFNRREPQDSYNDDENEGYKRFLLLTDGRYFKFHGYMDDPIEMLKVAAKRKHHFTAPKNLWYGGFDRTNYVDFHGNFREVSAAFLYRIYDKQLAEEIKIAVEHIKKEEWNEV